MKFIWSWGFMWTWSIKNLCFLKPTGIPTPLLSLLSCLPSHWSLASLPSCRINRYVWGRSVHPQYQELCSPKSVTPSAQWLCSVGPCDLATWQDKAKCRAGSWCCQGHLLHCLHPSLHFCFLWLWPTWYMCLLTLSSTSICTFWTSLSC